MQFLIEYIAEFSIAALGAFTLWSASKIHDIYVNRKYKLTGTFISRYYDIIEGIEVIDKTAANLKQKGYHVIGKDIHNDGRVWNLKGEFVNKRYLSGIYFAQSMHDLGTGSFFFDYDGRDLKGLWGGYDNVNKQITSGSYELTRMLEIDISHLKGKRKRSAIGMLHGLKVVNLLREDELRALRISDRVLGNLYLNKSVFNSNFGRTIALGAYEDGALVGFAISYCLVADAASEVVWPDCEFEDKGSDVSEADKCGQLGCIKIVAVREKSQGRGVGTRLAQGCEHQLRRNGAAVVVVPTWKTPDGEINIRGVLNQLGYQVWKECPLFWKEGCDSSHFECPRRQVGSPCQCDMVIFKKSF